MDHILAFVNLAAFAVGLNVVLVVWYLVRYSMHARTVPPLDSVWDIVVGAVMVSSVTVFDPPAELAIFALVFGPMIAFLGSANAKLAFQKLS